MRRAVSRHSLALKADGTVVGWGINEYREVTGVPSGPWGIVTIGGQTLTNVVTVAAGGVHSLFLRASSAAMPSAAPAPAFRILSVGVSNGVARLAWESISGNRYRLQYKNSLNAASWTDLPEMTATGSTATATNVVGAARRFYRVMPVQTTALPPATLSFYAGTDSYPR